MSYQYTSTTSLSDETYLESFVESTSTTLPSEIRRNLEHLRSLDAHYVSLLERWRDEQDACVSGVERALCDSFHRRRDVIDDDYGNDKIHDGDGGTVRDGEVDDDGDGRGGGRESNSSSSNPPPPVVVRGRGRPPKRKRHADANDDDRDKGGVNVSHIRDGNGEADVAGIGMGNGAQKSPMETTTTTNDDPPPPRKRGRPPKHKNDRRIGISKEGGGGGGISTGEGTSTIRKVARHDDNDDDDGGDDHDERECRGGGTMTAPKGEYEMDDAITPRQSLDDEMMNPTRSGGDCGERPVEFLPPPTRNDIERAIVSRYIEYPNIRRNLCDMHVELRRISDEKIKTSRQLRNLVDMALGRLDRDLARFESELGIDAPHHHSHPPAAAINVAVVAAGGSAGGGIGGGLSHNHMGGGDITMTTGVGGNIAGAVGVPGGRPTTAVNVGHHRTANPNNPAASYKSLASSSIASTSAHPSIASAHLAGELPPPHTASSSEGQHQQLQHRTTLATTRGVVPPPPKAVRTDNLAAIQVSSDPNSDWILAKVLSYDKSTRVYTLKDEDLVSNQIYKIPERRAISLRGTERSRWARGDAVFAVYPDTTSFYRATVSTPPFNGFVMVQFANDEDADGVTHEKAVLMAHVMKVPPGAK